MGLSLSPLDTGQSGTQHPDKQEPLAPLSWGQGLSPPRAAPKVPAGQTAPLAPPFHLCPSWVRAHTALLFLLLLFFLLPLAGSIRSLFAPRVLGLVQHPCGGCTMNPQVPGPGTRTLCWGSLPGTSSLSLKACGGDSMGTEESHCHGGARLAVPLCQLRPCPRGRAAVRDRRGKSSRIGTAAPGQRRGGSVTHGCSLLPTSPFSGSPGPCRVRSRGAGQQPEPAPFIPTAGTFRLSNTLLPFSFPSSSTADNSAPALFTGAKSTPPRVQRRLSVPAKPIACPRLCRARRGPAADTRAGRCLVISTKQAPRWGRGILLRSREQLSLFNPHPALGSASEKPPAPLPSAPAAPTRVCWAQPARPAGFSPCFSSRYIFIKATRAN